jgi:hypothetical protein
MTGDYLVITTSLAEWIEHPSMTAARGTGIIAGPLRRPAALSI